MTKKRKAQTEDEDDYDDRKRRDTETNSAAVSEAEREKILQVMENEPDVRDYLLITVKLQKNGTPETITCTTVLQIRRGNRDNFPYFFIKTYLVTLH